MTTREIPCAASTLVAGLLDGAPRDCVEVARTRVSVHYETGDVAVPVLTLCTPDAVRLPDSLVTDRLPGADEAASQPRKAHDSTGARVGGGGLRAGGTTWRVRRWWQPPRPCGLPRPSAGDAARCTRDLGSLPGVPLPPPSYDGLSPRDLLGAGPGLTPAGDDVLAGALVAAHATDDPRLATWRRALRPRLDEGRTTAVSRAMLHRALEGYATPQLARFVTALCLAHDLTRPWTDLLAVGHTSGGALLTGVLHTLSTHHLEGAA
ncbi:MAG TPA: DUF2877 domain-containing protein [Nocardioidaceae bacterium]|nr:DUF2877 domain-containing protein [Nocardioidaceae bacterium]